MLNLLRGSKRAEPAPAHAPERGTEGSIEIDDQKLVLESWSYTGFLARDYRGPRRAGEDLQVSCNLTFKGKPLSFSCRAKLIRVDRESRKLVGAFIDLDPAAKTRMAQVLAG